MATNEAQRFLSDVDTNQDLRKKLRGSFDQIVQTAQTNGYAVSEQDLRDELRSKWGMTTPPNFQDDADTCSFA